MIIFTICRKSVIIALKLRELKCRVKMKLIFTIVAHASLDCYDLINMTSLISQKLKKEILETRPQLIKACFLLFSSFNFL